MTKEDRNLLFKDLCARLPYGVFINTTKGDGALDTIQVCCNNDVICSSEKGHEIIDCVKPYLRPLESMTKEEYNNIDWEGCRHVIYYDKNGFRFVKIDSFTLPVLDYLTTHYFDFRYLIEKGLALEAKEGMYKTK